MSYKIIKNNSIQLSNEKVEVNTSKFKNTSDIGVNSEIEKDMEPVENIEVLQGLNFNENEDKYKILIEELEIEKDKILKEIMEDAKISADKLMKEVRESAYKEGYDNGFKKGYEDGFNKGNEEVEVLIEEAYETLKKSKLEVIDYMKREEVNIVRLAGKMAEKIVNHEIDNSSQTLIDMITPILSEFKDGGTVVITCNKNDGHKFRDNIPLLKDINKNVEYMIIETPQMETNKFSLEYGSQFIDIDTKKQIELMIKDFFNLEVAN